MKITTHSFVLCAAFVSLLLLCGTSVHAEMRCPPKSEIPYASKPWYRHIYTRNDRFSELCLAPDTKQVFFITKNKAKTYLATFNVKKNTTSAQIVPSSLQHSSLYPWRWKNNHQLEFITKKSSGTMITSYILDTKKKTWSRTTSVNSDLPTGGFENFDTIIKRNKLSKKQVELYDAFGIYSAILLIDTLDNTVAPKGSK